MTEQPDSVNTLAELEAALHDTRTAIRRADRRAAHLDQWHADVENYGIMPAADE